MIQNKQILNNTYEIIEQLGSGGGGVIYKAYHRRMQKYVAIKLIKDDIKENFNIRSEVDMLKNLKNDYLPQVLDFVEEGNDVYTVMEFIEGENFKQIIESSKYFSEDQVRKYACQLCEAVEYLHNHTPVIIHSDIKPANVMLTPQDNICLIDFNISMMSENGIAVSKGGSKDFAAPEQFRRIINAPAYVDEFHEETRFIDDDVTEIIYDGDIIAENSIEQKTKNISKAVIDTRTDIYGIGATVYYMLTSRVPLAGRPDFRGIRVSAAVKNAIIKAMDPIPAGRFKNVGEMKAVFSGKINYRTIAAVSGAVLAAVAAIFLINGNTFSEESENSQTSAVLSTGEIHTITNHYEEATSQFEVTLPETEESKTVTENNEPIDKYLSYYDFGAIKSETTGVNDDGSYEVTWYEPTGVIDKIEKYNSENVIRSINVYNSFTGEKGEEREAVFTEKGITITYEFENYYVVCYFDLNTHKSNIYEYYDKSNNLIQSFSIDFSYENDGSYKYILYNQDGSLYSIKSFSADNSVLTTEYYKNNKLSSKKITLLSGEETTDYYDENGNKITEAAQTTAQTTQTVLTTTVVSEETTALQTDILQQTWSETKMSAVMYVTENCYSRERAVVGSIPMAQYYKGDKVSVVAVTDTEYYKLSSGGYIHTDYVSEKMPETTVTYKEAEAQAVVTSIKIKGTQYSTSITELSLSDMELNNSDIADLKYMTDLKKLELDGNNITDISVLKYLTNLQELKLTDNKIKDFSPVKNLKKLKIFKAANNNVNDISFLSDLTELKELRLGVNNITDISPLKKLTKLEFLDLRANNISDISVLAELPKLSEVYLYKNNLESIKTLKNQNSITKIWIDKSELNGISALSAYKNADIMIYNDDVGDGLLSKVKAALPDCEVKLFSDQWAEIYGY